MTRRSWVAAWILGLAWTLWVGWAAVHRFLRFETTWAVDLAAFAQLACSGVTLQTVNTVDPMVPGQGMHFSPILYGLSPWVRWVGSPVPLLWAQAMGVGLGLVAGWRLAGRAMGAWVFAVLPAVVLMTCQQDFRPVILGMGSLAMAAAAYRERSWDLPIWGVLCLLCREEYALVLIGLVVLELGLPTGPRRREIATVVGLGLAGLVARAVLVPVQLRRPWTEGTVEHLDPQVMPFLGDLLPVWAWPFALFGPELVGLALPFLVVAALFSPETPWQWQVVGAHHHAIAATLLGAGVALGVGRLFRWLGPRQPRLVMGVVVLTVLVSSARLRHRSEGVGVVGDYLRLRAAAPLPHGLQGAVDALPAEVSVVAADRVLAAVSCRDQLEVLESEVPVGSWFVGPRARAPLGPTVWEGEGFVVVGPVQASAGDGSI